LAVWSIQGARDLNAVCVLGRRGDLNQLHADELTASLDRAFTDGIFSTDGFITKESWVTGETIVREAGILKQPVSYDEVIDMRFVDEVRKELGIR
jgi:hypothetical protein